MIETKNQRRTNCPADTSQPCKPVSDPSWWWFEEADPDKYLAREIHEQERWTGLYDKDGNKLYRKMDQIGFIRR